MEVRGQFQSLQFTHWLRIKLPPFKTEFGEACVFHFGMLIAHTCQTRCVREVCLSDYGVQVTMTERRTARRYDLSLPVIIRIPIEKESARNGKTRDISTRGVYFMIDQDLNAGAELDITLTLSLRGHARLGSVYSSDG